MLSKLTVTTPATSLALLTAAELRAAANVTGTAQDAALATIGERVAADITSYCNVRIGEGDEPTLLRETLEQTIYQCYAAEIILDRRHNVTITTVVEDGVTLTADQYMVKGEAGLLYRMESDAPSSWCAEKVVITYAAGFTTPPPDLKHAASDFVKLVYLDTARDPSVKSRRVDIYEVEEVEEQFWVGSIPGQTNEGAVPDVVAGQLKRYRNGAVA